MLFVAGWLCRVRIQCLEKLLGLSAEDAQRVAAAEPALLTFRWVRCLLSSLKGGGVILAWLEAGSGLQCTAVRCSYDFAARGQLSTD